MLMVCYIKRDKRGCIHCVLMGQILGHLLRIHQQNQVIMVIIIITVYYYYYYYYYYCYYYHYSCHSQCYFFIIVVIVVIFVTVIINQQANIFTTLLGNVIINCHCHVYKKNKYIQISRLHDKAQKINPIHIMHKYFVYDTKK